MKADIIDRGYLLKGKPSKKWRFFSLILIIIYGGCIFFQDNSIANDIVNIFLALNFLVFFIDSVLFTRSGELEIKDDILIIKEKNKEEKIIDLTNVEEVFFAKEEDNFYFFQVKDEKFTIEFKDVYVIDFKNKLLALELKIKHRNFLDRVSEFFSIQ